ncbi:10651_t:CDS:2 [Dentiscutata heterogama]|uniref:10651_t:CDS:1 n=1 Tax=Dentiscutata heterogama TaxID=1316150 RepID=A0ACA9L8U0_9GLOM|nr:10651_t:CDS:2 [Dentiscutata heterogama]
MSNKEIRYKDTKNQPYHLYQTVDEILEELEELEKKQDQTEKQVTEYKYIELSKEEEVIYYKSKIIIDQRKAANETIN